MLDATQRAALEALLAQLVATKSESGDEAALAAFTSAWLRERGLEVQVVERSVVARLRGGDGPTLLLNTHLDTVPAGNGWLDDPWRAEWEGDRLVGLGANDAKGCVAAMMFAAAGLAAQQSAGGPPLAGELILSLHHEEETTNKGMEAVLAHLGKMPDLAITGEPTGLDVVRAQSGLAVLRAEWEGKSCHAAHISRVEHENALLTAARELSNLPAPQVLEPEHELLGPSTLAPTVIRAGERHNKIPDHAEVVFDARLAAPHDADECLELLGAAMPNAKLSVRSKRLGPVETAADHPLVLLALEATGKPAATGSNTLSDMALLPGVPAIKCGPGETVRSHTPNEYITKDELAAGAAFYTRIVPAALAALRGEVVR